MTSENPRTPLLISLHEAACERLGSVERLQVSRETWVALPKSYAAKPKQRYPLVVVLDSRAIFGSAVEMSRLMAETTEIAETIVVGVHASAGVDFAEAAAFIGGELLPACAARYRTQPGKTVIYGFGKSGAFTLHALLAGMPGADSYIAANPDPALADGVLKAMRDEYRRGAKHLLVLTTGGPDGGAVASATAQRLRATVEQITEGDAVVSTRHIDTPTAGSAAVPTLTHGLRALLSTGGVYGKSVASMRKPLVAKLLCALRPLIARLKKPVTVSDDPGNRWLLRSQIMDRNFEIFVALPASTAQTPGRRYPALLVLDANIEFSTAAETAARMAAAGDAQEMIVIGVGVPRAEGAVEFGFRRFEEFSPPPDGYDFDDDLGRIFLSLFAMRGQDARQCIGAAPSFYRFLTTELLPQLTASLPLDASQLGILGHSAGGTFVGYALHQADSPFSRYAGVSPGIGISGSWLKRYPRQGARPASVYLCLGSEEKANQFNDIAGIPDTESYAQTLARDVSLRVQVQCLDGETHSSVYPGAVAAALHYLYPVESKA